METTTAESSTAESAAKTAAMEATAMEAAAEAPTGICRGRRKGTERGHRGEGNHRFTRHDNLLHNDIRGHKRCRRRIVAPRRAEQELNSPAIVQNLGMSSDRRPMSGSYCRRDACAISDVLAVGKDDARDGNLVHRSDGLADHGEGVVADLALGDDVVRPHQVLFGSGAMSDLSP